MKVEQGRGTGLHRRRSTEKRPIETGGRCAVESPEVRLVISLQLFVLSSCYSLFPGVVVDAAARGSCQQVERESGLVQGGSKRFLELRFRQRDQVSKGIVGGGRSLGRCD